VHLLVTPDDIGLAVVVEQDGPFGSVAVNIWVIWRLTFEKM
jgi:hypothetical protein